MKSISYYTAGKKLHYFARSHQTCLLNFACSETCLHSDPLSEFHLVNKLLV